MTEQNRIEFPSRVKAAFADREVPTRAVDMLGRYQIDSDVEEGLWFTGRHWRTITWNDWQQHFNALTYFSNEAFAFYLPSVLVLSFENPNEMLDAAQSLLLELDRSPSTEGWNESFGRRLFGLRSTEYEVIKEWLLHMCEYAPYRRRGIAGSGPGDAFGRAFETIDLLERETERFFRE